MIGLARFCIRHPGGVVAAWVLFLIAAVFASFSIGEDFKNSFGSLEDTGSAWPWRSSINSVADTARSPGRTHGRVYSGPARTPAAAQLFTGRAGRGCRS